MNLVWPVIINQSQIYMLKQLRANLSAHIEYEYARGSNVDFERDNLNWFDAFIATCQDAKP